MRQLCREFVVARELAKNEQARDLALAWHVAALQRTKKMPELKTLLRQLQPLTKQKPQEQLAAVHKIAADMGRPLKRVRLIRKNPHGS
jgi:hypothetical protein